MRELDAVGLGSDDVCEQTKIIWGGGGFGSFLFAVFPVAQAWVLADEGMASDDGAVLSATLALSKNSSWRLSNTSCLSWVSIWEVLPADPTIGSIHRSVVGSFMPVKIFFPLYLTTHLLMSNLTVHPTAVRTRIPNREALDNSGTIWPTSVVGRPGIIILHICVNSTLRPFAKATFSGHVILRRLWTSMPSMTNIWVAPESAIASFDAIVSAAYSPFGCFRGAIIKENMLS